MVIINDLKILAYDVRKDEINSFNKLSEQLDIELTLCKYSSDLNNIEELDGYNAISISGIKIINRELIDEYNKRGIKYISTRTIGYNHIDVEYAKSLGIKVCNSNYAPNGVADFTVMFILMCLRNVQQATRRNAINDFSLSGLRGREMRNLTIGIIGGGRIGNTVIQNLSGFGCKILVYDEFQHDYIKQMATYVDLDTLYASSDVISLHVPLTPQTQNMINSESISKMKDGVVIINCARGDVANTQDLITAIETKKISALALDTFQNETEFVHRDRKEDILVERDLFYLKQFSNVIITQHMAFYTDSAIESMVNCGVVGIIEMHQKGTCETII